MHLLDEENAVGYLCAAGWVDPHERVDVRLLAGGVSNQVLLIERPDRPESSFVLKQARPQLRTAAPWFATVERIWREVDVMRACERLLSTADPGAKPLAVRVPRVLFEDRGEFAFAMEAAPADHHVLKQDLLAGQADPAIAAPCGQLLGRLHGRSWNDAALREQLGDRVIFDQLRTDPYYRSVLRAFPDAAKPLERLIASLDAPGRALVLADFSPKNVLVYSGGLMLVDFETGHFGDPAFDLGFWLSHLLLKTAHHAPRQAPIVGFAERFLQAYLDELTPRIPATELAALATRSAWNLGGCTWARLDGTSPVDYLHDEAKRSQARTWARRLVARDACTWNELRAVFLDFLLPSELPTSATTTA
jgi:5-methylthioribose kinase